MDLDLSKLSAAPWVADGREVVGPRDAGGARMCIYDEGGHNEAEAEFIALARNALDVMLRRGWSVHCHDGKFVAMRPGKVHVGGRAASGWVVVMADDLRQGYRADPFTALVEADRWYAGNVENKQAAV